MREMHAVLFPDERLTSLKQHLLLFDKFHVYPDKVHEHKILEASENSGDVDYMRDEGIIVDAPGVPREEYFSTYERFIPDTRGKNVSFAAVIRDMMVRMACSKIVADGKVDMVPVCEVGLPPYEGPEVLQTVFDVALTEFPLPDDSSSLQDILDFKEEAHNKEWHYRRFLHDLSTKKQTEVEIRDHIDWFLSEYREGMKRRKVKIVQSAIAAFVLPAADIILNFSANHVAGIIGSVMAINKLRVELLEGEMKAPGRECAYVFDAQKRFGAKGY